MTTGAGAADGGGATEQLFTTCFTPFTFAIIDSTAALSASFLHSPVRVATPSFTEPDISGMPLFFNDVSTAACILLSFSLHDETKIPGIIKLKTITVRLKCFFMFFGL